MRILQSFALLLLLVAAAGLARAQAYCNITEVKHNALSNGIQILVKSDGMLTWRWESGGNGETSKAVIRFPGARIGLERTLYNVDQEPVSTAQLMVPQDADNGLGVLLQVTMTQPSKVEASLSEDRLTFMLTVRGQRTVEPIKRPNGDDAAPTTGTVAVTVKDGLISVRAMKANIHQVVSEIARQSGISVAVDDAVRHDISLNITDRKPLDVLKGIAAGYGLALSAVGDVYMLSGGVPADISTYQRSGTESFAMKYLKAGDAKSLLPSFLFKYVHDNPEQNAVVVTAPSQMLEKIGRDLKSVDIPPPMIMIECAVVELTDTSDLERAFRWTYSSPEHAVSVNTTTGVTSYNQIDTSGGLVSAISATTQLQAWLRYQITQGRAKVDAHPSMAAVNGKYAEIFIGSQRFIRVQYISSGDTQERLETVPVGIRLNIIPSTGGNGEITSWVKVEVSNIVQIDPETGVPLLGSRRAETTLRTRDGETIIIGGLTQRQENETNSRIPILGDLPGIGGLFRGKSKGKSNTELVILIRPRLLDENGQLPADDPISIRSQKLQKESAVEEKKP
ncbi:MAG: type II secretion system protein GspD [Armatimonadota bacterium]